MLFEESFQCRCCGILVLAFHGNGNGIAALNAHTHQSHQFQRVAGFIALDDGNSALILLTSLTSKPPDGMVPTAPEWYNQTAS